MWDVIIKELKRMLRDMGKETSESNQKPRDGQ
jgi:hypothetical protein